MSILASAGAGLWHLLSFPAANNLLPGGFWTLVATSIGGAQQLFWYSPDFCCLSCVPSLNRFGR